jgi:RNA polymerase sigma-70 factor, ECF subfamily
MDCGHVLNAYAQTLIRIKARQICRKAGFNRSDEDDLKQEMVLYLLGQAHRFDPTRASLTTFICQVVDTCAAMILRNRRRLKRVGRIATLSLESTTIDLDGKPAPACRAILPEDLQRRTGGRPDCQAVRQEDAAAAAHAIATMPPDLQNMCDRLMGRTVTAVARDLGTSRRQVRGAIATIRRHFERAGFKNFRPPPDSELANGIENYGRNKCSPIKKRTNYTNQGVPS